MRAISMLGAVGALAFAAGVANGAEFQTRSNSLDLNWDNYLLWQIKVGGVFQDTTSASEYPQAGDIAKIRATDVANVNSTTGAEAVMSLTVDSTGRLDIEGGGSAKLTIAGASPALVINQSDGVMIYEGVLAFGATTIVTGTGTLQGNHASAVIQIEPGSGSVTLTTYIEFQGQFTVQEQASVSGSSSFVVDGTNGAGVVHADASGGTIQLASSLNSVTDLAGTNPLCWKASGGGTLFFNVAATGLAGNFDVAGTNSVLRCDQNVTTTGTFAIHCPGKVDVNSATFDYASIAFEDCTPDPNASAISTDFLCRP